MKARPSKLDPHAATLLEMCDAGKTLDEMISWLKEENVSVARSTLSEFLESRRQQRLEERLLGQIATGAAQCKEVEKEFAKNPAPELETLIKLHRVLILQLSTQGRAEPEFLKLSDQLTNTVLQAISSQTKAHFKEREVSLAESKAAEAKKTDQQKALEFCLEESKAFPEVQEQFKSAFAALKKARASK